MTVEQMTELLKHMDAIEDWIMIGALALGAILGVLFVKR